jgi:tRNA threonylcarbamoyladenosine biosynthesis protein TsaE
LDEPGLQNWAREVGESARTPLIIALRGDLGAGKSVFARALARGAGVQGALPSPTFNLLFRYETPRGVTVSHLDLYRLEDPEEVWELGWRELGEGNEIVLIEWPERAEDLLPKRRWDVVIKPGMSDETRIVTAQPILDPPAIPAPR